MLLSMLNEVEQMDTDGAYVDQTTECSSQQVVLLLILLTETAVPHHIHNNMAVKSVKTGKK